eukprot:TRINITY_DN6265_c4_g1_i1.p1 TRINITY_DN6265_c4_g1~~TRINITY_DN6265_c4_g1_i1.p1  ORF type:complete len:210 (-),score=115.52 TRINITY_DN6265_c4_g1_i1:86-715(-)
MSVKPKLTYFNLRGRAEVIRYLFEELQVEYEDFRFEMTEKDNVMNPLKADGTLAFGQVPLLQIDGINIVQSKAAARYIGNKYGLGAKNAQQEALIDILALGLDDASFGLGVAWRAGDKRDELMAKYAQEELPKWLGYYETLLKKNNSGTSFFVGDSLTWVDFAIFDFLCWLDRFPNSLDNFESLKAFKQRIASRPKIAAWIARRPVTHI